MEKSKLLWLITKEPSRKLDVFIPEDELDTDNFEQFEISEYMLGHFDKCKCSDDYRYIK